MTTVTVPRVLATAEDAIGAARRYAESIAGGVIERDRAGAVPAGELAAFDASGLLSITVPREHGGAGLPASVLAEVGRLIAYVDPAIAQAPQAHFLFVDVLAVWGSEEQQRRLFGDVLAAAGSATGSPSAAASTPRTCRPGCAAAARGCACRAASTTAPARSPPAGSASARWTTPAAWCWRSSSATLRVSRSTRTGT